MVRVGCREGKEYAEVVTATSVKEKLLDPSLKS